MSAARRDRAATVVAPAHVSDHALLRYLERVKGIDIEAARAEVVAIVGAAAMLGARASATADTSSPSTA